MYNKHTDKYKYAGLTGICIASFLGCIDLTVVNTIIPAIGREFAIPLRDTQWVTSVFMIALSAFMVPAGTMADQYGRKRLLLAGLLIFGVSSLLVGITHNFLVLIIFRFLQGLGCAILYTVSGAIISYLFSQEEQGKALGILFGVNGLGLAIGPVVGGIFSGLISWRYAFLINIPFILSSIYLCLRFLPEQKSASPRHLDIIGCLLLIAFLITLVSLFSLQTETKTTLVISFSILIFGTLFLAHEIRTKEPIVEFHFFKSMRFIAALASTFFLAFFYCIVLLAIPVFMANFAAMNDLQIGLLLLPATVTFALTSTWVGNRSEALGPERAILYGTILFIISGCGLAIAMSGEPFWLFITPLIFFGAGWGLILGPSTLVALRALPEDRAAVAMGTSWTLHNVGGACGVAFAVYLVSQNSGSAGGFKILMYSLSGIAAVMTILYALLNKKK